jgi:hypothetical protein
VELLSVGDVARRLDVRPAQVTQLFYERKLRDDLCPVVAGRRLIPPSYVDVIAAALRRKGIAIARRATSTERSEM